MTEQVEQTSDILEVGRNIRKTRKVKKLTQEKLAERISDTCSLQTVSRWEKGTDRMNVLTFFDICAGLDVEPNELAPARLLKQGDHIDQGPAGYGQLNEENQGIIQKMVQALLLQQNMLQNA